MIVEHEPLLALGYWRERSVTTDEESGLPGYSSEWLADPQTLVRCLGPIVSDPAVVEYLQCGTQFELWRGYSWCRFECGAGFSELGHADLTDGIWVWPEGLAHYVSHHGLPLPEEFLATVRRAGTTVVNPLAVERNVDKTFWSSWYTRYCS